VNAKQMRLSLIVSVSKLNNAAKYVYYDVLRTLWLHLMPCSFFRLLIYRLICANTLIHNTIYFDTFSIRHRRAINVAVKYL